MNKGAIDFHAHIIPYADHGCDSVTTALKQLSFAAANGVSTVVSSSHFYPHIHTVDGFLKKREDGCELLAPHLEKLGVTVVKGAEVQLCVGLEKMRDIEKLCIGNTDVLLVEVPDMPIVAEMYETVEKLRSRVRVVFAHVDRYPEAVTRRLIETGCMLQLNAEALTSPFNIPRILRIVKSDLVFALGSDIHGADAGAYRRFAFAQKLLGANGEKIQHRMHTLVFGE